jgi:hypothetical protein
MATLNTCPTDLEVFLGPSFFIDPETIKNSKKFRYSRWFREVYEGVAQIIATTKVQRCVKEVKASPKPALFHQVKHS